MAVRQIVYYPDTPLTKRAAPVESFDAKLHALAEDMLETMHHYEGVGLAAPQVGLAKRLFVMQEPEGAPLCFVNPEIVEREGSEEGQEGCLSMPRIYAMVPRATRIRFRAQTVTGDPVEYEFTEFPARIVQHESDHLDGILFPERLDIITRQEKLEEWAAVREQVLDEISRAGHAH
jgi:peptide deformylase